MSCNSESEDNTEREKAQIINTNTTPDSSEIEIYEPEPPIDRPYSFEEFNKDWIMLDETEEGLTIVDSWDSQQQGLHFFIDSNGTNWLNVMLAQDSDDSEVKDFEATLTEGDGFWVVNGSFTVQWFHDEKPRKVDFTWDYLWGRYAEFKNIGMHSDYFVPESDKDFFPTVKYEREEDY